MDDTLSLLQRLVALLSRYFASPGEGGADRDGPSLAQIVGWSNVLLDAHFSQLLMHTPGHALLHGLNGLARRHVKACSSLKGLKGYLSQATSKAALTYTRPVPQYSVEALEL